MARVVVLLGPPGSGKSTIGLELEQLGFRWRKWESVILERWGSREGFVANKAVALPELQNEIRSWIDSDGPIAVFETTGLSDALFLDTLEREQVCFVVRLKVSEERLVAAALANQRGGWASSAGMVDTERIATLERALTALAVGDSQARASLLATLASELTFSGDLGRRRALAADAESMVRRLDDDSALLRVLNLTFVPLWVPDGFARTVAASQEALMLSERVGDPVARFGAAQNRLIAMASSADRAGIDAAMGLMESLGADIGHPYLTWFVTYGRCWRVLLAGNADEAESLANDALQIGLDIGQPDALTVYGAGLLNIRWHQGRTEEMLPLIEQAAAESPDIPAFQAVYAQTLCECGRVEEATPLLERARRADFHHAAYDYIWLTNTAFWGETAAWLGDTSAADVLFERLAPYEPQGILTGATFTGTVGMCLARLATVLGRNEEANDLFERTDARLRALGAPFLQARNEVEWAQLLRTTGSESDDRRARELLDDAVTTAAAYGCAGVERRAHELAVSVH